MLIVYCVIIFLSGKQNFGKGYKEWQPNLVHTFYILTNPQPDPLAKPEVNEAALLSRLYQPSNCKQHRLAAI